MQALQDRVRQWFDKKKKKLETKNNWFTKSWFVIWEIIWFLVWLVIIVALVWLLLLPDSWKDQIENFLFDLLP